MADIFISYKKEDAGRVIRMVEALRAEGFDVWWDHGIKAGTEWDRSIHKELYAAKVVIAIWSNASVAAPWVKEEATVGKSRGVLVPARIDDVDPPLGFMMIQAADLVDWSGDRVGPALGAFPRRGARHSDRRGGMATSAAPAGLTARVPAAARREQSYADHVRRHRHWRWSRSSRRGWMFMRGQGPAPVAATPPAAAPRVAATPPVPQKRQPARASRSSGTGRWRKRPARRSRPIWSAIPTASMRSARATRCSPAAPRPRRSGSPDPMSPTRWCAASPAVRCRPA